MNPIKCLSVVSLAFGLALAPLGPARAQDAFVGSWVLDAASYQGTPGLIPTAGTLEVTAAGGGQYKSVSEVALGDFSARNETTYSIDGKDYAVTSTPAQPGAPEVTQAIERTSDTVYKTSLKLGGQQIATAVNELSADRNTLTVTTTGIGQFAMLSSTAVFRRK